MVVEEPAELSARASVGAMVQTRHGELPIYTLSTDQLGTQLDPPAHWAPEYPTVS